MKKVNARLHIDIISHCPHCGVIDENFDNDNIKNSIGYDHQAKDCNVSVICSECKKEYIIENIEF